MADEETGEGVAEVAAAPAAPLPRIAIAESKEDAPLTLAQVQKARACYEKADTDGSNDIDKAELATIFKSLNLRLTPDMFDDLVWKYWKETDVDVSGTISLDEFLILYRKVVLPQNLYGTKMLKAAGRGHVEEVRSYVSRGCNANAGDGVGWSCVHHAAEYGRVEVIKELQLLLGMELDIDAPDNHGWTPLFNAASNGHVETMQHLIKSGANVAATSANGRTALHIAASTGHASAVQTLIAAKAKVNTVDNAGWTALYLACMHSHHACIRALLEAGTDIDIEDECGYTIWKYCNEEIETFVEGIVGQRASRPKSPRSPRA